MDKHITVAGAARDLVGHCARMAHRWADANPETRNRDLWAPLHRMAEVLAEALDRHHPADLEAAYAHDDFVNDLLAHTPDSWDDDAAAESIALDYVRELERRVTERGGTLERWAEDEITGEGTEAWREGGFVNADVNAMALFAQVSQPYTFGGTPPVIVGITGLGSKPADPDTAHAMGVALIQMARQARRVAAAWPKRVTP